MIRLFNEDCFEAMDKLIKEGVKVDMVLTDPPYKRTKNKWDVILPHDLMWTRVEMLSKDNTPIVLFGQGSFSAKLMMSNEKYYRYSLVWDKVLASGFLNCNRMPLVSHEDILIFYKKMPIYNPQKFKGKKNNSKGKMLNKPKNNNYGDFEQVDNKDLLGDMKFPKSILSFQKPHPSKCFHPTEKPVELLEYLIKTYTKEGDTVLDFTMGSGSTGVACKKLNRNFIGIEINPEKDEFGNLIEPDKYFKIAKRRIEDEETK